MIRIGIVADDITGSNDIGIMFAKAGYRTTVYNFEGNFHYLPTDQLEVVILNTNSRLDEPQTAYRKVYAATQALARAGCTQFHNKTCSVFRGNIGAEFDAMLDALDYPFALVILGFPKNGRTTLNGRHYVRGVPLEESEFRRDPAHPMTCSNLVEILQSQTQRAVGLLTHEVISQGATVISQHIQALRSQVNYLILDVADQSALEVIAQAVADEPILCGSSAIGEVLPLVWQDDLTPPPPLKLPRLADTGILCAAGSLMPQTAAQIDHLRQHGALSLPLDTTRLFEDRDLSAYIDPIVRAMQAGQDVIFHTAHDQVAATRAAGQAHGYSPTETARLVSESVAEVVAQVLAQTGQNRLLIAGGETSDAVCKRLGIHRLQIYQEIQPGLPSCIALTDPQLLLVLKSGSFGSADFFEQALAHLRSV